MHNIFAKEEEIVESTEKLLLADAFSSIKDAKYYENLAREYQHLLNHMKRMIRMSDLMEAKLNTMSRELDEMAKTDFLTNLYNRRFFDEFFHKEWQSAIRTKTFLSIIIIDIDQFKKYNDTYGHLQGDKCLQFITSELKASLKRPRDFLARFGGEEFVFLLPETDISGAQHIAEGLLSKVAGLEIPLEGFNSKEKITVSIGLSSFNPRNDINPNVLIQAADEALYIAKEEGRNCIRQKVPPMLQK